MKRAIPWAGAFALILLGGAAPAAADGKDTMMVPVADATGDASDELLGQISEAVRAHLESEAGRVEAAQVGLTDVLAMGGCTLKDQDCLKGLTGTLQVDEIVISRVEKRDGALVLSLYRIRRGSVEQITHPLSGDSDESRAEALTASLAPEAEPEPEPEPAPEPEPESAPEPEPTVPAETAAAPDAALPGATGLDPESDSPPPEKGFAFGRVRAYSWALAGSGIAIALGSLVPYALAGDKQDKVDVHPTDTAEDFAALAELEDDARTLYGVGNGMLIGGAVLTATGVGLILMQSREESPREQTRISVSPPARGAGFVLSLSR